MRPDAVLTTINAVQRLRRLEEAYEACLAAGRALNALGPDDVRGEYFDTVLQGFDCMVDMQRLLAPRIKQTRAVVRAGKRQAEREAQP